MANKHLNLIADDGTRTPVLAVDIAGDGTSYALAGIQVSSAGSSIVKSEDAAHASGDPGVMSLAVRKDTLAALAGADGDYAPLEVDSSGNLYTRPADDAWTVGTVVTADGQIVTGTGRCKQLLICNSHASNPITAVFYDGTSTSGTQKTPIIGVPAASSIVVPCNWAFGTGIYVDVGGTGTPGVVAYWV